MVSTPETPSCATWPGKLPLESFALYTGCMGILITLVVIVVIAFLTLTQMGGNDSQQAKPITKDRGAPPAYNGQNPQRYKDQVQGTLDENLQEGQGKLDNSLNNPDAASPNIP